MSTYKASVIIKNPQPGAYSTVESLPIPKIGSNQLLIKTVAVAANPTDWKHIIFQAGQPGNVVGSDASGIVTEVGADVKGFKEGDIVSTFLHGNFSSRGAFGEYVIADPNTTVLFNAATFKKDEVLKEGETYPVGPIDTFEGSASITLGLVTVSLSLAGNLNVSAEDKGKFILIWGGATATGTLAIQVAKLAFGLKVITVSSPKNFDYLKQLGADYVFNYHDSDVIQQIKAAAKGEIKFGLDTVSTKESFQQLYSATYDSELAKLDSLLFLGPNDIVEDDRKGKVSFVDSTLAYLVDGNVPLTFFGIIHDIKPETKERYDAFWFNVIPKILPELKHSNLKVLPKGLETTNIALNLLQQDKVSGEKLVFRI